MKRKLLTCAALALAAGSLSPLVGWTIDPSPSATKAARQWLERMIEARQTLNYEGTFVYIQGPHVESMRIIHGSGPNGERQRLFSLNGPPREVVVADNQVICLLPRQQATLPGSDYQSSPFPLPIPRELGRLENYYAFEMLGEDRIAGLETRVIAIKPRDAWRFGYRLWLDEHNGMLLRSALLDEQGQLVEQLMFIDVQVKSQIDESAFQSPVLSPEEASTSAPGSPDPPLSAGEPVAKSAWQVGMLPEGFSKVLHNHFTEASGQHPTEHLVFADGLATISVFLEKLDNQLPVLQGASRFGSMNAFGRVVAGHQVLVVGEVPTATVQRIATSIRYAPEEVVHP
ncbi:MAG: MucB/RseB C-terminal domain-containing protein [Candidatus Competibacteraceae bacterium]|nr:MucB/RseB C-terminal domain-containing protein [Candidatus Competibacteraceae bacterium]